MACSERAAGIDLLLEDVEAADRLQFDTDLAAPDLLYVEIAAALARAARRGGITGNEAGFLLEQVLVAPIDITPMSELVSRAFELREIVTVYDGCYVALAEQLGCGILTADVRLARAPGLDVPFTLI